MKPVSADPDLTRVSFAKNLLESADIACVLHNEGHNTLGPPIFSDPDRVILNPTLAVLDDSQYEAAMEIIQSSFTDAPSDAPDWKCPACNESNPSTFDECWNCKVVRPGSSPIAPA